MSLGITLGSLGIIPLGSLVIGGRMGRIIHVLVFTVLTAISFSIAADNIEPSRIDLAKSELRRYVFLRTGELLPISENGSGMSALEGRFVFRLDNSLSAEEYRLKGDGKKLEISGGSDQAVLYGVYRYAELMGVRFYVHGDVIPDERIKITELPECNEAGKPLFSIRGIQPFHDFQEGPDWWNQDDYIAYITQLAKMRMNFIGLHCYPEGGVGPEPLVWIGVTNDIGPCGTVKFSYPSEWATTDRRGMWGYATMKTSDYAGGASLLFAEETYGPDVMSGLSPRPKTPEECNELFNRVGKQMNNVFKAAKRVGVKTCIGTETPITIPNAVRGRSTDAKALYTGMFKRIAEACPVDYYWLWTPEGWTWGGNNPKQFEDTTRDIQAALDALKDLGNPFTLATSGWVLGPTHNRAALDEFLPKDSPMSCINRQVGHDGVEPAFANVTERPKWAIPWMENDPNMVGPQPWAARMRHDAVDALRYGCTGLLGIHWRTKALEMNVAALASAAWDQSWVPQAYDTKPVKLSKGGDGALGGTVAGFKEPVADADVQAVYQNVRYDLKGYTLVVPDGTYNVTLLLNEPHYDAAGKRVFGAMIQGRQVVTNLDIFARVGKNKALNLEYKDIIVKNGMLSIEFTKEVEFPCIAGIAVAGMTKAANQLAGEAYSRKINCGGGKEGDYEADRESGGTYPTSPRNRAMPIEDFYYDWSLANFGKEVAEPAGKIFARIDGLAAMQVSDWVKGPGGLKPNGEAWENVKQRYAFVAELANLREKVNGGGNLERFDYWLNTYRAMLAMSEVSCLRGKLDREVGAKKYDEALKTRIELAQAWTKLMTLQVIIVTTPGELGTIANLEQHSRSFLKIIEAHDTALEKALGRPLPDEVNPGKEYTGPARIIVPTVRSQVAKGEALSLQIMVLASRPCPSVTVRVRELGAWHWKKSDVKHLGQAVYRAALPVMDKDYEYYVEAKMEDGKKLIWPATAPAMSQTVVVW